VIPGFTKMRAPEGFQEMTFGGRQIRADVYGLVIARVDEMPMLEAFGFKDASGEDTSLSSLNPTDMNDEQLVDAILLKHRESLKGKSRPELLALFDIPLEVPAAKVAEHEPEVVVTREDIATLHRKKLFHFLRDRGVKTAPAMKDPELRELAYGVFDKLDADLEDADEALAEIVDTGSFGAE
jgi:hypothetical protein